MKRLMLALFVFMAATAAFASNLTATWIEGTVERKQGSSWTAIKLGDIVKSSDVVRLAESSTAEFSDGRQKVTLTAAGTFSLSTMLRAGASQDKRKASLFERLARILSPDRKPSQDAVGGVRGKAQADSAATPWVDGEGEADAVSAATGESGEDPAAEAAALAAKNAGIISAAWDLVKAKDYRKAAEQFGSAVATSQGGMKAEALYGQAWSLEASGSTIPAIKILRSMPSEGAWAGPRVLLLARLDLGTGAYAEARSLLEAAIGSNFFSGEDLELAKAMLKEAKAAK
jgi:hypothetical protein